MKSIINYHYLYNYLSLSDKSKGSQPSRNEGNIQEQTNSCIFVLELILIGMSTPKDDYCVE